jgi:hypothetical protein
MANIENNCEKIWKIWKKGKLICGMIWKIWNKTSRIVKIQKKIVKRYGKYGKKAC